MFRIPFVALALAPALLLGTGCERRAATQPSSKAPEATVEVGTQVFQVTGVVVEVQPERKQVRIKHDEIPGYMQAMTMPFEVRDTNELSGLEPGHPVAFRMTVTDTDGWIDQIRITGAKRNDPPTTGPFRLVREVEPLEIGDRFPEYTFTNQFGRAFGTDQFKGQALAINFLFTRCPYPTFCPQTARYFAQTQQELLSMNGAPTNWHLLTISFDPEFDTPAVLESYAQRQGYKPDRWTFATGALIDITALGDQVGLKFWREENGGFNHNLRTVVVDASGKVQRIINGNEWTPLELVTEMLQAMRAGNR
jgi:protein SCO1/2